MTVWWPPSTEVEAGAAGSAGLAGAVAVPAGRPVAGRLRPPSSKSLTHRALALALLARQRTVIHRPLQAEDTELFLAALATLGFRREHDGSDLVLSPPPTLPSAATLHCGNAGTMFRFLVAIAATLARTLPDRRRRAPARAPHPSAHRCSAAARRGHRLRGAGGSCTARRARWPLARRQGPARCFGVESVPLGSAPRRSARRGRPRDRGAGAHLGALRWPDSRHDRALRRSSRGRRRVGLAFLSERACRHRGRDRSRFLRRRLSGGRGGAHRRPRADRRDCADLAPGRPPPLRLAGGDGRGASPGATMERRSRAAVPAAVAPGWSRSTPTSGIFPTRCRRSPRSRRSRAAPRTSATSRICASKRATALRQ